MHVRSPQQAFAIGTLHGLAGTGAVVLLLIAALPSQLEAALALAVFAPMSVVSMTLLTERVRMGAHAPCDGARLPRRGDPRARPLRRDVRRLVHAACCRVGACPSPRPGKILTTLRFIVGGSSWLAPDLAGKAFGLDSDANPQSSYVGRLFARRDAALGVGLVATEGDARRLWWQIGIACDVADAAAGVIARKQGRLPGPAAVMVTATALAAAGLGAAALAADDV